jgi:hypothetical protein
MSRITVSWTSQTEIYGWIKTNQNQIQNHIAWYGNIGAMQAENLLQEQDSFTYLLRNGEKKYSYFITFVTNDHCIKHQYFSLESDRKGWYYKNGVVTNMPTEIVSENLDELIPAMMHCNSAECKELLRSAGT